MAYFGNYFSLGTTIVMESCVAFNYVYVIGIIDNETSLTSDICMFLPLSNASTQIIIGNTTFMVKQCFILNSNEKART